MEDLISIIMPFKNCGDFLEETIGSILNQTYENWELIAINDHSADNSEELIQNLTKDKRIKVITNNGDGIINALQTGYKIVKGNYITRMDADDIMQPSKLEVMQRLLYESSTKKVVIGKVHYFKSNGSEIGNGYLNYENWINSLAEKGNSFKEIYKECPIPSPSWMLKRELFEEIGGFNSSIYPEDYELAFRMYEYNLTVVSTKEKVHLWRDYETRTSRTHENYKDNRFLSLKVNQFIKLDYNQKQRLSLLGAGKKGKLIAKLLIDKGIKFDWCCNNENKIGHIIYNKELLQTDLNTMNTQFIIAIANKTELLQLKEKEILSNEYYYFC